MKTLSIGLLLALGILSAQSSYATTGIDCSSEPGQIFNFSISALQYGQGDFQLYDEQSGAVAVTISNEGLSEFGSKQKNKPFELSLSFTEGGLAVKMDKYKDGSYEAEAILKKQGKPNEGQKYSGIVNVRQEETIVTLPFSCFVGN